MNITEKELDQLRMELSSIHSVNLLKELENIPYQYDANTREDIIDKHIDNCLNILQKIKDKNILN